MHKEQQRQHLKSNDIIPKLVVIVLSIVLLTGMSLVPTLQGVAYGQSQQQASQEQKQVGLSQVIKQIAQQVANANPGTNANDVYQILVQLAKQTAQATSQEQAIQEIRQMSSQISASPSGTLSQSLAHSAQQLTSSSSSNSIQATQITPGFTGNYTGTVNRIVDGDTLYIGKLPIRLSLVNTPERGQPGFIESKNFTAGVCDVGEKAKFNIDDKQKKSYNRTVAIVYCVEQAGQFYNVNEQLLLKGHAKVLPKFCSVSEFSTQAWVSKYCNQPVTAVSQAQANDINALYILIENLFNIFPNNPTVIQLFNQINNLQITQNVNSQEITVIKEKVKTVVKDKEVKEKVREVIRDPDDKEIVCLYDPYHDLCPLPDEKGKCPEGWAMNEDERCYPYKKSCPEGYWRADNNESGACVKKKPPKQEPPIRCPEGSYRFDPASQTCVPLDPPPENKECPEGYMKGEAGACIKKESPVIPLPPQQIPNCNDVDPNAAQDCKTDSGQVCEAGTTEDGCELDGYHCTDEQGCGNYEDGICVDCPKDEELPVPLEDQNAFSPEVVEQIPPQEPLPPVPDETIFDESPPPPLLEEDPASLLPNNDAPEQEEEEDGITTLDDEAESEVEESEEEESEEEESEEGVAVEEEEVSDDDGDESEEDDGGGDDGGGDGGDDGGGESEG